jgi:malate dehydrogenase (oxaloacetate-decarboxylating)(NADP+)
VLDVIGLADGVQGASALSVLQLSKGAFFFCDTFITPDPTADELVEMAIMAAEQVRRFGIAPKVALLSHSNFGTGDTASARKMREAVRLLRERAPELEVEGEMDAASALDEDLRSRLFPASKLAGQANLLIMPSLDAANIAFNMVKMLGEGLHVGPILIGARAPAHILTPSVTVRGITNMSALAVVDAQRPSRNPDFAVG